MKFSQNENRSPLIPIFLLVAVTSVYGQGNSTPDLGALEWLLGRWTRTNGKAAQSGTENWIKMSPVEFSGTGITMQGIDTVFSESLKIIIQEDQVFYVADVAENKASIYFRVSEIMDNGFVCENAAHDFPKKIIYRLTENRLSVTVSGDGKSFDLIFTK